MNGTHTNTHITQIRSSENFAYDDYDDHSDYPPPRYITKSTNMSRHMEANRYNDPARDHYTVPHATYQKQPMMVIRTYPATTAPPTKTVTPTTNAIYANKQHLPDNNNYSHRNYYSHHNHQQYQYHHRQQHPPAAKQSNHDYSTNASNARRIGVFHSGMSTPKMDYNGPMDDDDDVVDYHKMNATNQRTGFVRNSAALWDRRAAKNTTEFNTIV